MSTLVVERWEARVSRRTRTLTLTWDADNFRPSGDRIAATPDPAVGALILVWAEGTRALLADGDEIAGHVREAAIVAVRWVADGLLRGADLSRR